MSAFNACINANSSWAGGWAAAPAARDAFATDAQRVLEHCAVNFESLSAANEGVYYHADQLLKSLYVAYLPTWLRAFGRRRLLLLRAEDYWASPATTLGAVSDFLGLGMPSDAQMRAAVAAPIAYLHGSNGQFWGDKRVVNRHAPLPPEDVREPGHVRSRIPPPRVMPSDARALLTGFFAPHNARLAELLDDQRYRWEDVLRAATV